MLLRITRHAATFILLSHAIVTSDTFSLTLVRLIKASSASPDDAATIIAMFIAVYGCHIFSAACRHRAYYCRTCLPLLLRAFH